MLIILPLSLVLNPNRRKTTKEKKVYINLNWYRNAHFYELNDAKIAFKEVIQDQIDKLPLLGRIRIKYILYPKTKKECDVANICSIADKFFCDALTESGVIVDDNYKYLDNVGFSFGAIDKNNPRVEAHIEEIEMRVSQSATLDQKDIARAIGLLVREELNLSKDTPIEVSFADGGLEATAIVGVTPKATPVKPAPVKREGEVKTPKAEEPKEAASEDQEAAESEATEDPDEKVSLLNGPEENPTEKPSGKATTGLFARPKQTDAGSGQVGGSTTEPEKKAPMPFSFGKKS